MKLAFATNEGQTSRVTETPDGAIFALHVDKVIPSQVKPLDEVKDKAVAAWQADRRREIVAKEAEELAAAVTPETRLATAAGEKGLKATTSPPLPGSRRTTLRCRRRSSRSCSRQSPARWLPLRMRPGHTSRSSTRCNAPRTCRRPRRRDLSHELDTAQQSDLAEEFTPALRAHFPVRSTGKRSTVLLAQVTTRSDRHLRLSLHRLSGQYGLLDNLDAILSTPGLDAIYVGPSDLSISLGYAPGGDKPENG